MKIFVAFLFLSAFFGLVFSHDEMNDAHLPEDTHRGIFCVEETVLMDLVELFQARDFHEVGNALTHRIQKGECAIIEKEGYAFLLTAFAVELPGLPRAEMEIFRVRLSAPPFLLFFENGQIHLLVLLKELFLIKGAEILIREMGLPADTSGN